MRPDLLPVGQDVAGEQETPGIERAFIALPILVRDLTPVTFHVAHEEVGERDRSRVQCFERPQGDEDTAQCDARLCAEF
ncbi:hypothetical protein D9M68_109590 [compost metagenome]